MMKKEMARICFYVSRSSDEYPNVDDSSCIDCKILGE